MARFRLLCLAFQWFMRILRSFLRRTATTLGLGVNTFRGIVWRQKHGSAAAEPETDEKSSEILPKESSQQVVEETGSRGQHEDVAAEMAAGVDPCSRPTHVGFEQPGRDEESEDDFNYGVEGTDEYYCCYDSSWESDEQMDQDHKWTDSRRSTSFKFKKFLSAARDMQNYRHDYPTMGFQNWSTAVTAEQPNLDFYLGEAPSVPDGVYIHEFHDEWAGKYDKLEYVHTFIQWLFPLPEPGMNYQATPLTREEIQSFCESNTAKNNLLKSYKLMLDFYGIELRNEKTGDVEKASNWRERFYNLNSRLHNNLRITRILKCLGILGYPHYQEPLVHFFLKETLENGELPNVRDSVLNYFVFAVRDKKQRRRLIKYAYEKFNHEEEFVWCPKKIQRMWSGCGQSQGRQWQRMTCEFEQSK
ncbi:opioid growth factor receptor-like [Xyrichtys novacula]|uniref:Opioid growth factor receptor-like n=1 Tax=Xyrichtys novacula TaxID=13765 RepID=A0AAV1ERJ9_XYRNO|nr:opioid growth factor receptor-like [Xyrichtys novacula]